MAKKRGIVIFVKDRTTNLDRLLTLLMPLQIEVIVINDSVKQLSSKLIKDIVYNQQAIHINEDFYYSFLAKIAIDESEFNFLIRKPGVQNWNLGYMRNLALLVCKAQGFEEVAFLDDDILPLSSEQILDLFDQLSNCDYVGARIVELVDDSVVGHIVRQIEVPVESNLVSGGCLFFCTANISNFFLNIYNEDWIWQLFNIATSKCRIHGTIRHLYCDPFIDSLEKVRFQEFGEVYLNGISNQITKETTLLASPDYWQKVLRTRLDFLSILAKNRTVAENEIYAPILQRALSETKTIKSFDLSNLYIAYRDNLPKFMRLYNSL
jgi:hypothetical protein